MIAHDKTSDAEVLASGPSSVRIVLDSLPYIDHVHPDYEAYALDLIEEEMNHIEPNPHALRHLRNPLEGEDASKTPLFQFSIGGLNVREYDDVVAREGQPRKDIIDYINSVQSQLPKDESSVQDWTNSMDKAKIELEYERIRLVNAELQAEFETSIWKEHSVSLDIYTKVMNDNLTNQKLKVDQINANRKEIQETDGAPKLLVLDRRWIELIRKNSHLSQAIGYLEAEVQRYRDMTGVNLHQDDKSMESDDDL